MLEAMVVAACVIDYVRTHGIAHIVVGTGNAPFIGRLLVGSVSEAIVSGAHGPVTVARRRPAIQPAREQFLRRAKTDLPDRRCLRRVLKLVATATPPSVKLVIPTGFEPVTLRLGI